MLFRRLVAGLVVLGLLGGLAVPVVAQDKGKEKDKGTEKAKEPSKGGDKVTLKWKFEKDKVFFQKMTTKTVQTMKVMGNDVNQTQNQTFYFSYKPIDVKDDKVEIEQTIIGVAMDIEIGGSKISYDSTKETTANNPLGEFFKALKDTKFTVIYNPKEVKIEDVKGRAEFIGKLTAANPQMKQLLETILSDAALKEMAEPTFAVVPKGEVSKGESWKRTSKLDMGPIGTYENVYTYTSEGPQGDKQKIKVDVALNYAEPKSPAGQGGLPFVIKGAKLTSKSTGGEILFDSTKGRLDRSSLKLQLDGDLKIEIGGQTTDVKLSQTQESSIETSDTDPVAAAKK